MGRKTLIGWCDSSLNLQMGCNGCELWAGEVRHCYAGSMTERYAGRKGWPIAFEQPAMFPERLKKALRWPDLTGMERPDKPWLNGLPRLIFLNDMGDTFTEGLPIDWLLQHIPAMEASPHIFQILTKRPKRMLRFFRDYVGHVPANFWLGTSVTDQKTVNARVPELIKMREVTADVVLFLSIEPLLGAVDLQPWLHMAGMPTERIVNGRCVPGVFVPFNLVIVGGESGSNARPMHPVWARGLRGQCRDAGVHFFFKQWGEWAPFDCTVTMHEAAKAIGYMHKDGRFWPLTKKGKSFEGSIDDVVMMMKVGNKNAGRLLDGREWSEMPSAKTMELSTHENGKA